MSIAVKIPATPRPLTRNQREVAVDLTIVPAIAGG